MGWFLFVTGWLALAAGLWGTLALPALLQGYSGPVLILGAVWIAGGAIVERIDMLRRAVVART